MDDDKKKVMKKGSSIELPFFLYLSQMGVYSLCSRIFL